MYQKDFAAWHQKKAELQLRKTTPYFYEREVWWVAIGHNVGNEEDGKGDQFSRPVLILRKFNSRLFYGVPLTTAVRRGKYYYPFMMNKIPNVALLSHLRSYDSRRLLTRIVAIDRKNFEAVQSLLREFFK